MTHFCNIYYCLKKKEESPEPYVRKLLEYGFMESFGIPYRDEEVQRGRFGKPYSIKKNIHFNISHGQKMAAAVCADVPVGVDVESPRRVLENTIKRCCTEDERAWMAKSKDRETDFLKLWTLKESYVKMTGQGFHIPPDAVGFSFCGGGTICCDRGGYFKQYELKEGILSVCIGNMDADWDETIKMQKMLFGDRKKDCSMVK